MSRYLWVALATILILALFLSVPTQASVHATTFRQAASPCPLQVGAMPHPAFRDAISKPPATWTGTAFHLSCDYPAHHVPESYPWESISFLTESEKYLRSILAYAREGNSDPSVEWVTQVNSATRWYHAPGLLTAGNGREWVHGLTRERPSRPFELHVQQTQEWTNWAVGMYNIPGGHVLGQVWADPASPEISNVLFPTGTLAIKLLFTEAPTAQVPYLDGSLIWSGDIKRTHKPVPLRLLQFDFAVRDPRADITTGWVFGTFVYSGTQDNQSFWNKLVPVGLMWGNDPGVTDSTQIKESWINPVARALLITSTRPELGWRGRLNGPVDNPNSSCLSCHSTASYTAQNLAPAGNASTVTRLRWFENVKPGELPVIRLGTPTPRTALDYSLQLAESLDNYPGTLASPTPTAGSAPPALPDEEAIVEQIEVLPWREGATFEEAQSEDDSQEGTVSSDVARNIATISILALAGLALAFMLMKFRQQQ